MPELQMGRFKMNLPVYDDYVLVTWPLQAQKARECSFYVKNTYQS